MKKILITILMLLSFNAEACQEHEKVCLAKAIYWEARGEHLLGKLAVSSVILYRVNSPEFPNTICSVVKQFNNNITQFSVNILKNTPIKDKTVWGDSLELADNIISGRYKFQLEFQARYFHSILVSPNWSNKTLVAIIGNHKFYY